MKTERLYYSDNHMKEFSAVVESCTETENGRFEIVLDRTAFFPEGGGQCADTGRIGEAKVYDTQERGEYIVHYAEGTAPKAGETVECAIDWAKRFDVMQQHSGEHIVSGVIHSRFGYDNVGFHIGADYVTLDTNGTLTESELWEIEDRVNEAIWANIPILCEFPSAEKLAEIDYRSKKELTGEVRIVTIPGYDICACCGVHVSTTGEIGSVKIVDAKKYKSGMRITIRCGARALVDHREKQNSVSEISRLLSAKPEETAQAVEKLLRSFESARYQLGAQEEKLVRYAAQQIKSDAQNVCVITSGISAESVWKYAAALQERFASAAVFSENECGFSYSIVSSNSALGDICKEMNKALSGRGGGRGGVVRGSVACTAEEISAYFKKMGGSWEVF